MVGTIETVLVENVSRKSETQVAGRAENNRVVNFTGDKELIGRFVEVRITEARTNSLQAEYVGLSALETVKQEATKQKSANPRESYDIDNNAQRKLA